MAQSFTAKFQNVLPSFLWIKMVTLFKDSNRPNTESPNSSTSMAEPQPAAEFMSLELDIESLQPQAYHGTTICQTQPSPSLSSSLSPKRLLHAFTRNFVTQQSTHDRSASSAASQSEEEEAASSNNPIAKLFLDQDLGKTIIGFLMPMTAALISPYAPTHGLVRKLIFLSLSLGLAALWNGILLRRILPRHAIAIEQIGAALVLLAFYGLISSFLPDYLVWIPCISFLLVLFPFILSYFLDRVSHE